MEMEAPESAQIRIVPERFFLEVNTMVQKAKAMFGGICGAFDSL